MPLCKPLQALQASGLEQSVNFGFLGSTSANPRPWRKRAPTGVAAKNGSQNCCVQLQATRAVASASTVLIVGGLLAALLAPAHARILTDKFGQRQAALEQTGLVAQAKSKTRSQNASQTSVRDAVAAVLKMTSAAKEATNAGNYKQALEDFSSIVRDHPDLAIANYARVGRALMLYQTGCKAQAILELEDLEVALRGFAEVHAALACIIYCERPSQALYAEQQFALATEFDSRYSDVAWVRREKGWPPAMLAALNKFVNLD